MRMSIRIVRWVALVSGLVPVLLAPLCAYAEEKSQLTVEQVDKAIREVEKLAQREIQENAVPGLAIAVVFQDKLVYAKGFGVRDVKTKAPVDADTVFQLASVSKPIGSTVVAELVGEGKVTWDSKLSVLDPTFAMFDPWVTHEITIRDMRTSQRLARTLGRPARRFGIYTCANFISPALSTSRKQFSFALRLHEFWYHRRRRGGGESIRAGMGRRVRTKTVQTARYDFDEFAVCGFCRAPEQSAGTCAGGWQVGAKVQARSGHGITRRRRQFFSK